MPFKGVHGRHRKTEYTEKQKGDFMTQLLFEELSFEVRDAAFHVFRELGSGFREETYKRAFIRELSLRKVLVESEFPIAIQYKGVTIDSYRLDLVVEKKIVVELKSAMQIHPQHIAQLISYLKASHLRVGLLINMGADKLQIVRRIY
jgi:GxxExxY protein